MDEVSVFTVPVTGGIYEFKNVTTAHTITANFILISKSLIINAECSLGGEINPVGLVSISNGDSHTFVIKPAVGYSVSSVLVDGTAITSIPASGGSYTFNYVTTAHTITANFKSETIKNSNNYGFKKFLFSILFISVIALIGFMAYKSKYHPVSRVDSMVPSSSNTACQRRPEFVFCLAV